MNWYNLPLDLLHFKSWTLIEYSLFYLKMERILFLSPKGEDLQVNEN